jgi:hypothetical protein
MSSGTFASLRLIAAQQRSVDADAFLVPVPAVRRIGDTVTILAKHLFEESRNRLQTGASKREGQMEF